MSTSDLLSYASSTVHLDGTGVVEELEQAICRLTGFVYALLMSSASAALAAVAEALGFSAGDEVIVPPLTAPETIAHLLHLGCIVVFGDIERESLTLNPAAVEACITERTRGIVGVDVAGRPHASSALRAIAEARGLLYVADLAQGFGARVNGHHSGHAADAAILSLNAQKAIKCGEGGVLLTNSDSLYRAVVSATQHAHRQLRDTGAINYFSRNARINPLAAAVALATLPDVLERIEHQRRRAARLITALNATGLVVPIKANGDPQPTYPYVIARWRDRPQPSALLAHLQEVHVSARLRDLPVKALHLLPSLYEQFPGQVRIPHELVQTEDAVRRCFCLEAAW